MDLKELESAVEGILFASGEPVEIDRICDTLEVEKTDVETIVQKLSDYYSYERRGIRIIRIEDMYQMTSAPEFAPLIRKTMETRKPPRLSQAALEVLSIIAYFQPTTKAYIEQIRGVDCTYTVGMLLDRELIEEAGKLAVPGRPNLYRTTKNFLRSFNLNSLEDLPPIPDELMDNKQMELELPDNLPAADYSNLDFTDEEIVSAAEELTALRKETDQT